MKDKTKGQLLTKIAELEEQVKLLENTRDIIYSAGPDGILRFVNNQVFPILGYTPEEMIGKSAFDFIHPEDSEHVQQDFQNTMSSGREFPTEFRFLKKDGSEIWVEELGKLHSSSTGKVHLSGVIRDISERKQAQEYLEEKNAIISAIAQTAEDCIFCKDINQRYTFINPAMEKLLGRSSKKLLGKTPEEIFNPETAKTVNEVDKINLAGNNVDAIRKVIINEKMFYFHTLQVPMRDNKHNIIGICGIVRDITEQVYLQKKLAESEEKYRNVIEHSNEIFYIHDAKDNFIYISPQVENITGYKIDEDWKWPDLLTDNPMNTIGFERTKKALQTGKRQKAYVLEIRKKNGQIRYIEVDESPFKDAKKNVIGIIGIVRDITERKIAEDALRLSEKKHRALLHVVPDLLFELNKEGFFLAYKAAREDLYAKPEDFLHKNITEVLPAKLARETRRLVNKALKIKKVFKSEYTLEINNVLRTFESRYIASDHDKVLVIIRDITDQKHAEEILKRDKKTVETLVKERTEQLLKTRRELEKAKRLSDIGMLAATVAHELRNPLNVIKLAAFNIERKAQNMDLTHHIETINKKIAESDQIIRNLLYYSRIQIPLFELIDFTSLLNESIYNIQNKHVLPSVLIDKKYSDSEPVLIHADPVQMTELISNILDNAFQSFPDKKGTIEIKLTVQAKKNSLLLTVKDSGTGIDRETQKRIFEPFFTTRAKGIGLGLSVCRQIVELHNGKIAISSKKDQGTKIAINLPINQNKKTIGQKQ